MTSLLMAEDCVPRLSWGHYYIYVEDDILNLERDRALATGDVSTVYSVALLGQLSWR